MKRLFLILFTIPTIAFAQNVVVTTDRFTGDVKASYRPDDAVLSDYIITKPGMDVYKYKTHDGIRFNSILLSFSSRSWRYLRCDIFKWLIDGKPFTLEVESNSRNVHSTSVYESFSFHPTNKQLSRLAEANTIEFKVCNDEYRLTPEAIKGIAELNATILN